MPQYTLYVGSILLYGGSQKNQMICFFPVPEVSYSPITSDGGEMTVQSCCEIGPARKHFDRKKSAPKNTEVASTALQDTTLQVTTWELEITEEKGW